MKKSWNNSRGRGLLALLCVLLLGACQQGKKPPAAATTAVAAELYTCSMHPQIIRDKPGDCPICGMTLVKKQPLQAHATPAPAAGRLQNVLQAPNATVVSPQPTVHPAPGAPELTLTLPGRVEYDVRRTEVIAARFGGRVEKLFVRYNYQPVTKGQKLLELYSPELVTAQQELIFILTNDAENRTLLQGARQKLRLLGLTDAQINQTATTRKPQYQVAIYSPYTGYVVEQAALSGIGGMAAPAPPAASADAGGMGSGGAAAAPTPEAAQAPTGLLLTEGAYVTAGQSLFRVINTSQVWGVFQPRPDELAGLRVGQAIRVVAEYDAARAIRARIDLVEPFFRERQRTGAVRVHLRNPAGRLRSGALLTGSVAGVATGGLWLPRAAVVDLGTRQVAFVRANGAFRAVTVQTGRRSADRVQILSGLQEQDAVATNAQFLVDSEGFVQTPSTDYHD